MENLTISEVAHRTGVPASTLRYYESVGLLSAPARVSGRRRYTAEVLDQLAVIRLAQEAGFTIAETQTLLHGFSSETPPPERWRELATRKLPEVDALIARAQMMRRILETGLACACLSLEECARRMLPEHS